eukprot:3927848-Pyramimonas_sp.AAC.1
MGQVKRGNEKGWRGRGGRDEEGGRRDRSSCSSLRPLLHAPPCPHHRALPLPPLPAPSVTHVVVGGG